MLKLKMEHLRHVFENSLCCQSDSFKYTSVLNIDGISQLFYNIIWGFFEKYTRFRKEKGKKKQNQDEGK